jgi:hypothetical protein
MIIRAGFSTPCFPAGNAMALVTGEMCVEDAEDVIALLELTIRNVRRQIALATKQPLPAPPKGE